MSTRHSGFPLLEVNRQAQVLVPRELWNTRRTARAFGALWAKVSQRFTKPANYYKRGMPEAALSAVMTLLSTLRTFFDQKSTPSARRFETFVFVVLDGGLSVAQSARLVNAARNNPMNLRGEGILPHRQRPRPPPLHHASTEKERVNMSPGNGLSNRSRSDRRDVQ